MESAQEIEGVLSDALRGSGVAGIPAYLYGSVAEGRAQRESDVDVGVLLDWKRHPTRRERFDVRLRLSTLLSCAAHRPVDVVILNDAPPMLGRHVVTRGRCISCADRELAHAFVCDVQMRAADIEPFLRRTRAIKLRALAR